MQRDIVNGVTLPARDQWDCIAFDMVLLQKPSLFGGGTGITLANVCDTYDVTSEVLDALVKHKDFQFLVRRWNNTIDRMGDKAPVILRAQIMSSSLTERAYQIAMSPSTETSQFVKIWEIMLGLGGHEYKGGKSNQNPVIQTGSGSVVYVNVPPNIPGMEHVYGGSDKAETNRIIDISKPTEVSDVDEVITSE